MRTVWTRRSGIALGVLFAIDCIVETWSHQDDGVAFWFLTTFTATVLVLAGSLPHWSSPFVGACLVAVGGAVGMVPTAWTIVIPVFVVAVVALSIIDAWLRHDALHP